jgi:hypothetical protein
MHSLLNSLVLIAAVAAPSPAPTARAAFSPYPVPSAPADYTLSVTRISEANFLYSIFAPYCSEYGGISHLEFGTPYPVAIDCVHQRLSVSADLKVTKLGP